MALGPGEYDALATHARERSQADAVVVIVVRGNRGSGMSVQVKADVLLALPALLRSVADSIEQDTPKA